MKRLLLIKENELCATVYIFSNLGNITHLRSEWVNFFSRGFVSTVRPSRHEHIDRLPRAFNIELFASVVKIKLLLFRQPQIKI